MRKLLPYLKNKFILASVIFCVYGLFLDDYDVFLLFNQQSKLKRLERNKVEMAEKLEKAQYTLNQLRYASEVERFAREKKLFKKDDEDIFVIFYE